MTEINRIRERLQAQAKDGSIDVEDVQDAVRIARTDGKIDAEEHTELQMAARLYKAVLEPGARKYLQDVVSGKDARLVNRVLLAPHPKGSQRDLYYARTDVVALQESLNQVGFAQAVDGDYGPATEGAVRQLQKRVSVAESGVVDSNTLAKLNDLLEAAGASMLDLNPRAAIRPDRVLTLKNGGSPALNKALQEALCKVAKHFGVETFKVTVSGVFDEATENVVRKFQLHVYLPATGIVDDATLTALNSTLEVMGAKGISATKVPGGAGFKGSVELHFYPGDAEHKIYVMKNAKVLDVYGMVGGHNQHKDDPNNPTVDYGPSPEGRYIMLDVSPHVSGAWSYSYVPYGAYLRIQQGEVQYRDGSGRWRFATGPQGVFAGRKPPPLEIREYLDLDGNLKKMWDRNDFGHLRGRFKNIATGALQSHMIHSSPINESAEGYWRNTDGLNDPAQARYVLGYSHGCEHIHPRDMDELVSKGYIAPGTVFVVHGYDEFFGA